VNCAAIPEHLVESELFGYEKGAFSGADTLKTGYFEMANNGTLFLDEIGDLDPKVQVNFCASWTACLLRLGGSKKSFRGRACGGRHEPEPGRGWSGPALSQ